MNCQEVNEKIFKYCDGELSPQEHANMTLHLDKCPVCRHMCQLTLMENDVLRDTDDIPELSPAFTALVIDSIKDGSSTLKSGRRVQRLKGKIWLGGTVAAAAIILFLCLPQLNVIESRFLNSDNASQQEQHTTSSTSTSAGSGLSGTSDQAAAPDTLKSFNDADTKAQIAETPVKPDKPAVTTEDANAAPMILSETVPTPSTSTGTAPDVYRAGSSDRIAADAAINSDVRPINIPERLKFVQVSSTGDNTIYNYASLDGKEYLQLTVKPYSETTVKTLSKSANVIPPPASLTVSRNIQIGNKMVTVVFSGNLSLEEINKLADSIQFPDH